MTFVADASMAVAWVMPDERDQAALTIFERASKERVVVPFHWRAEVANSLLSAERTVRAGKRRLDGGDAARLLDLLNHVHLSVDRDGGDAAWTRILPLARAHGLTIYDALYLELAERLGLALATFDTDLADAARSVGVEVLP